MSRSCPGVYRPAWIAILLPIGLLLRSLSAHAQSPVRSGWMDFGGRSLLSEQALDGEWDFFWQQWLRPEIKTWPKVEQRVTVPSAWNHYIDLITGETLNARGYATYRLRLTGLRPEPQGYRLHVPTLPSSVRVFVYQEGTTSPEHLTQAERRRPHTWDPQSSRPLELVFYPQSPQDIWGIVVQVAHTRGSQGGLTESLTVKPADREPAPR